MHPQLYKVWFTPLGFYALKQPNTFPKRKSKKTSQEAPSSAGYFYEVQNFSATKSKLECFYEFGLILFGWMFFFDLG